MWCPGERVSPEIWICWSLNKYQEPLVARAASCTCASLVLAYSCHTIRSPSASHLCLVLSGRSSKPVPAWGKKLSRVRCFLRDRMWSRPRLLPENFAEVTGSAFLHLHWLQNAFWGKTRLSCSHCKGGGIRTLRMKVTLRGHWISVGGLGWSLGIVWHQSFFYPAHLLQVSFKRVDLLSIQGQQCHKNPVWGTRNSRGLSAFGWVPLNIIQFQNHLGRLVRTGIHFRYWESGRVFFFFFF